ncbi:MAG TPA: NADH-quinone oxidoreductase subunit C, partial [Acidimicrobiales bacterium]|nr:NADH-quinone oxidoreductase subunit C [Acidimicrobiales bacterium]
MSDATEEVAATEQAPVPEPELLHGCPVTWSRGQQVVHCLPAAYEQLVSSLKDEGYEMCVDVTATDYLEHSGRELPAEVPAERFEVVVNLLSMSRRT